MSKGAGPHLRLDKNADAETDGKTTKTVGPPASSSWAEAFVFMAKLRVDAPGLALAS